MSFEICPFEQGSDEWKALRRSLVTASDVAVLLGLSPYQNEYQLLWQKLNGEEENLTPFKEELFAKGHRIEKAIRRVLHKEYEFEPMVLISQKVVGLMASLDGINVSRNKTLEVKYVGKKNYPEIASGKIPKHHEAQVQAQLVVSGMDSCLYVPCDEENYVEIEIKADETYHKKIINHVKPFYKLLTNWRK